MPTLFGTLPFLVLRTVFWWASEYLDPPYLPTTPLDVAIA